jgi:Rrf2 family protein
MLSNKAKYGLKAMFFLARRVKGEPVGIEEIARSEQIPKKFLDAILLELRNSGLLYSRKGRGGGYSLLLAPAEISIGRIVRVLDGPLAPIRCASKTAYRACDDCPSPGACQTRRVMQQVRDATATVLDNMTLADVIAAPAEPRLDPVP